MEKFAVPQKVVQKKIPYFFSLNNLRRVTYETEIVSYELYLST
jgi:hypothetical protein